MKIDVTAQELEALSLQAMQDLLSSDGFGNPDLFDGDFVSHGRKKKKNNSIHEKEIEDLLSLYEIENIIKEVEKYSCVFEQKGEFYELDFNFRQITKINFHHYGFKPKKIQTQCSQDAFFRLTKLVNILSSLLNKISESEREPQIKVISTNYKMRAAR